MAEKLTVKKVERLMEALDAGEYTRELPKQDSGLIELILGDGIQYIFPDSDAMSAPPAGKGKCIFHIGKEDVTYDGVYPDDPQFFYGGELIEETENEELNEAVCELKERLTEIYGEEVTAEELFQKWGESVNIEAEIEKWRRWGFYVYPDSKMPTVYVPDEEQEEDWFYTDVPDVSGMKKIPIAKAAEFVRKFAEPADTSPGC